MAQTRHVLAASAVALAVGTGALGPAPAEAGVTLTRDQMITVSLKYLADGEPQKALVIADTVLEALPNDVRANVLRARALLAMGQAAAAEAAARRAWDNAESESEKFDASMVLGETLSLSGRRTTGQFWFRRASTYAGSDRAEQIAANAFRITRSQNPWSVTVDLGLSPNNNVNNASTADTIEVNTIFGTLPFTPVVYSGWTGNVGLGVSYRFDLPDNSITTIGIKGSARVNWLDDASKTILDTNLDPDDSYHDFDYASLALTLSHSRPLGEGRLNVSAQVGQGWYGWEHYDNTLGINAQWTRPLNATNAITLFASNSAQIFADPASEKAITVEAGARFTHIMEDRTRLSFTFAGNRTFSDDDTKVWYGARGGIDLDFGKPFLGADIAMGASLGYRYYPADLPSFGATDRTDWLVSAYGEAAFEKMAVMGFAPVASLSWSGNLSSLPAYERGGMKMGLGLRSTF